MSRKYCEFIIAITENKYIKCSVRTEEGKEYIIKLGKERRRYELIVGINENNQWIPCEESTITIRFGEEWITNPLNNNLK